MSEPVREEPAGLGNGQAMGQRHCPYLGLRSDPTSTFTEPTEEHRCNVAERRQRIELNHQADFCLTSSFEACPRFLARQGEPSAVMEGLTPDLVLGVNGSSSPEAAVLGPRPPLLSRLLRLLEGASVLHLLVWVTLAVFAALVLYAYLTRPLPTAVPPTDARQSIVAPSPSPTESPTESPVEPTPSVAPSTLTPAPPTATPAPDKLVAALMPADDGVGWVYSGERSNHFGDRNLHVGTFEGHTYHGAMQFSLSSIPLGSRIERATLELVGLSAENLVEDGTWALRLLGPDMDQDWASATYDQIHRAPVADTIPPEFGSRDLAVGQVNTFHFSPIQYNELERRLERGRVCFRFDGPSKGANNLFTWDTGVGGGLGSGPVLRVVYQPPPTPTSVVVAATSPPPTPANVVTAAALAAAATYEATAVGTPTPWPDNVVTPTPPYIITNTPTPGNRVTAQWVAALATAQTFLDGTPTPLPSDVWTATPVPTYVIITSVPTPENVLTAAAVLAAATHEAVTSGTATPWPANVVTPIPPFIVTHTPTPGNRATAERVAALATAQAFLDGTPTPLPTRVWTATPVPTYVIVTMPRNVLTVAAVVSALGVTPTPPPPNWVTPVVITNTPTPQSVTTASFLRAAAIAQAFLYGTATPLPRNVWTATPAPASTPMPLLIPLDQMVPTPTETPRPAGWLTRLRGKIIFRSDRLGGTDILTMDPDGTDIALLTDPSLYDTLLSQESLSPDGRYLVLQRRGRRGLDLYVRDLLYNVETRVTFVAAGIAYDATWSPDGMHIAFASDQDGDDEIFVVRRDGGPTQQLTQNIWEWDKHPSFSPDGRRIVYASNVGSGRMQIWVMNADGSDKHNISNNVYNEWDPVWTK